MNEKKRIIKDVVNTYIRIYKPNNNKKIKVIFEDYSYIYMTIDYILADNILNKKYYVYNYYVIDDTLQIYVKRE